MQAVLQEGGTGDFGSYPLEGVVERLLSKGRRPKGWTQSGFDRSLYVDLAEPIFRKSVEWQQPSGGLIDPYEGAEPPTSSARFVGAAAGVIGAGRSTDLLSQAVLGFDYAAEQLGGHKEGDPLLHGADFYAKELAFAFEILKSHVDQETLDRWRTRLSHYLPDAVYTDIISESRPVVHNFNIYGLTGEYLRFRSGLGSKETCLSFVEAYIPRQFQHFTEYGMYRDPNDPMTYDLTVRQNLSLLLWGGYDGQYRGVLDELLRRGALTTLLFVAPDGQAPFGGRSNQYHHMEGMIACIGEYEAVRYARLGEMAMAGAFKRLARLAAASTRRWWSQTPWRDLKNSFHPLTRHGREGYGEYSVYSLLAASLYGVAHHWADDSIPEAPMPAELGGYVMELPNAFHKVFATGGGYHVAIDTNADLTLDATGLGRLAHPEFPIHLGLSMPLCGTPKYLAAPSELRHAGIGPVWRSAGDRGWTSLAQQNEATPSVEVQGEESDDVQFDVCWEGVSDGKGRVTQHYRLRPDGVTIRCAYDLDDECELGFEVPLLLSDGGEVSVIAKGENGFVVQTQEALYSVECTSPTSGVGLHLLGEGRRRLERAANRNGVYRIGVFALPRGQREITVKASFQTK